MNNIIQSLKIIVLAIVLSFGLSYVYAWTAPTLLPPDGNVSAPINTSTTSQFKGSGGVGGLGVEGLIRGYSNAIFDGQVGIGTTAPGTKLDVTGGAIAIQPSASEQTGSMLIINNGYQDKVGIVLNQNHTADGRSWYVFPRMRGASTSDLNIGYGPISQNSADTSVKALTISNGGGTRFSGETLGASCASSLVGAQAYNNATGAPLYCNGTVWTAVGGGPTDVYSSKIIDGAAGGVFSTYCRITKSNGLVECKIANDWNMTSFGALITPFPATTPGSYSLSCQQGIAGAAWPACCRTNNATGSTECRRSNTWTLATPWVVVGSPF